MTNAPKENVRRVVTGVDDSGKAVVLFDTKEAVPVATEQPVVQNFWTLNNFPAAASMQDSGLAAITAAFGPSPQKLVFRTVDFPPSPPREILETLDNDLFMNMAGEEAPSAGHSPSHPFMHRTKTIDFGIVISGEINMVLDDSIVILKAGDVLVQQETNHAWVNNTNEVARIAFVQLESIAD